MIYTVVIQFLDGEKLTIEGVREYTSNNNTGTYTVEKNGYLMFFNKKEVKYIARDFDIRDSLQG